MSMNVMVTIVPDAVIKQEAVSCVCEYTRYTPSGCLWCSVCLFRTVRVFCGSGVKGLSARSQPGSGETHGKFTRSNVSSISSCTSDFFTFAFNYSFLCWEESFCLTRKNIYIHLLFLLLWWLIGGSGAGPGRAGPSRAGPGGAGEAWVCFRDDRSSVCTF